MNHNMNGVRGHRRDISFDALAIGRRLVNDLLREQAASPFRRQRRKKRAASMKALAVSPVNARRARQHARRRALES